RPRRAAADGTPDPRRGHGRRRPPAGARRDLRGLGGLAPRRRVRRHRQRRRPARGLGGSMGDRRAIRVSRDDVLAACVAYPDAVEDYPFGDEVAVFKIGGRMFALVSLEGQPGSVHLKCDPDLALELRDRYPAVLPGYHLNTRHWNTVA